MVTIASALSAERCQRPPQDLYPDQEAPGPLGRDRDTCLEIAGLFIVFAEFPGVYKAGRTMVLMKDEDAFPTKSLYILLHTCRTFFHVQVHLYSPS